MTHSDLIAAADQAFAAGKRELGLEKLREHSATPAADAGSWNRLAVVEEQIGDWARAGHAHRQCIAAAPHIAASYVYAGYWLQKSGLNDAAAAAYSLAQECDPASLSVRAGHSSFANSRAQAGNQLLRQTLSTQHKDLFSGAPELKRIATAVWPRTHDNTFSYGAAQFAPELFFLPELNKQPYYSPDDFPWATALQEGAAQVRAELATALEQNQAQAQLRPYLPENSISQGPLQALAGSLEWSALDLYRDGQVSEASCTMFPNTLKLLESVPLYALDEQPFEVFFSLLKPGQVIAPHYGQSNHSLTVHLPLEVPTNCYLEVAGEQRHWQSGELLIFDDSYLHSAHNPSTELRIVLILSVWHPALSSAERAAIQRAFKTRQTWMAARVAKLDLLLGEQS